MKVSLVTGASSGIGREFVKQLSERGYDKIYCIARRESRLCDLIKEFGNKILPIVADLSVENSFSMIVDRLNHDNIEKIDTLVAAAGFGKFGSFANNSEADMEAEVNVNILGVMRTVRAALPFLKNGSKVLIMGSQSSFQPLPEFNVYASTKAFILHFGRALNVELSKMGVTVTTVCPGYVATEFFDVAKKSGDPNACQNFSPLYLASDVVRRALVDSDKGKDVSIYGARIKGARLLAKILPHKLVMRVWLKIK